MRAWLSTNFAEQLIIRRSRKATVKVAMLMVCFHRKPSRKPGHYGLCNDRLPARPWVLFERRNSAKPLVACLVLSGFLLRGSGRYVWRGSRYAIKSEPTVRVRAFAEVDGVFA